jgi:hypothetical protein
MKKILKILIRILTILTKIILKINIIQKLKKKKFKI